VGKGSEGMGGEGREHTHKHATPLRVYFDCTPVMKPSSSKFNTRRMPPGIPSWTARTYTVNENWRSSVLDRVAVFWPEKDAVDWAPHHHQLFLLRFHPF
jgi:hypothetical protein